MAAGQKADAPTGEASAASRTTDPASTVKVASVTFSLLSIATGAGRSSFAPHVTERATAQARQPRTKQRTKLHLGPRSMTARAPEQVCIAKCPFATFGGISLGPPPSPGYPRL